MSSQGTVEEPRARGRMYGALSLAFYPPTPIADRLQHDVALLSGALAPSGSTKVEEPEAAPGFDLRGLESEYNRLFVGPGHVVSPPYESVYATAEREGEQGLVLGTVTLAVQARYREAGLALAEGFNDLPDHVAVELEFMKYMCDREAETAGAERTGWQIRQSAFINSHLGLWVPRFADSVVKNSVLPYYRAAARLLRGFVEEEVRYLPAAEGD